MKTKSKFWWQLWAQRSLTCGTLRFIVSAALSISQAAVVTLAHVTPVVLDTAFSFAACCQSIKKQQMSDAQGSEIS